MSVNIKPLKGYALIEPVEREAESQSGIVLEAEPKHNSNTEGRLISYGGTEEHDELVYDNYYTYVTGISAYEKQVVHGGRNCIIIPIENIIGELK